MPADQRPSGVDAAETESAADEQRWVEALGVAGGEVYLIVRAPDAAPGVRSLAPGAEVSIGRDPGCDFVLDDGRASRRHARIRRTPDALVLEDLGSRNGTLVNGERLRAAGRALAGGDVVRVGALEMVVAVAATPAGGPPSELRATEDGIPESVIVADAAMLALYRTVRRLARAPSTVLILGETGSGKEVVAEMLHRWSPRAAGPLVRLNCASLPEALVESELFGHERGAFTGADRRRIGHIEAASGGTLLLDELGELPLGAQAKLLRVLESRRVQRLGASDDVGVDVRIVCATQRDLERDVAAGRFREDLYYRVSAFVLRVPPLRERPTEISLLATLFARDVAARLGRPAPVLGADALAVLVGYAWPGNVRELRHALEHAVVLAEGEILGARHLPDALRPRREGARAGAMRHRVADLERAEIVAALRAEGGNRTRAAKRLGISRGALLYKLGKYGVD